MRVIRSAPLTLHLLLFASIVFLGPAHAGNVRWTMGDSLVAVCPAGDSVVAGHPSVLRVAVTYTNGSGTARVGVPPESIWVTLAPTGNGSILLRDATDAPDGFSWKVFADDSTDANGLARFRLVGFAGCGDVYVRVYVDSVSQGTRTARVRSLDADLHDPVDAVVDSVYACDWDYSGAVNASDYALLHPHADHGHRNVLHGTLVRRTSLCGTCTEGDPNTLGEGGATWNPAGTQLSLSIFDENRDCAIFLTPASPADGNTLTHFSFPPSGKHDYDPEWSPLGDAIAHDRADNTCWIKKIYGLVSDSSEVRITTFDDGASEPIGDVMPAISPDGKWVVFSRKEVPHNNISDWHLWKIAIRGIDQGATAVQLTSTTYGNDLYPRWAPDGQKIYFERQFSFNGPIRVYSINPDGSGLDSVLTPSGVFAAATPAVSPDGKVLTAAVGSVDSVKTRTLRLGLGHVNALDKTVENYPSFHISGGTFPIMTPRLSPDGTRLVLRSLPPGATELPEIWAARRNMSLPPSIDALGGESVNDQLPVVDFDATVGEELDIVVEASDPEDDPLTYKAYFMREDLDMAFNASIQTFSWIPPVQSDLAEPYHVRFQVETISGGTDYAIARITVHWPGGGGGCPTLSTYTGRGWRNENTILGRSRDGRKLTDVLKLREKPARVQDHYRLQIAEHEQERTALDQVRLLAVDHDPKMEAVATEGGAWLGQREPAHRVRTTSGKDVTSLFGGTGEMFAGNPGEILLVDMDDPAVASSGSSIQHDDPGIFEEPCCEKQRPGASLKPIEHDDAAAIDASILDNSGFTIQASDQSGVLKGLGDLQPRENGDVAVIEGAGHGQVRVAFKGGHHLKFIGKLANAVKVTPLELPLVVAKHSEKKNVLEAVAGLGVKAVVIDPGQTLNLEFEAPPVEPGMVRDLFLVSRGVYTAKISSPGENGQIPLRFALAQNQPNPFGKGTVIRFELPTKAKIKLEVFDLLGRRVRVLADREFEPGYQSVEWDRNDRSGSQLPAGIYLYRMTAPGFRDQKKMTLLP